MRTLTAKPQRWMETQWGRWALNAAPVLVTVLAMVALGDRMTETPAYAAAMGMMFAAVVLLFIDYRLALLLFVAFLFGYEEFNLASQEAFVEENIAGTVLEVKVFGFALMDMISLVLLLPVLLREWRHAVERGRWRWMKADAFLLPLVAVWLWGIVPGLLNLHSASAFTWDLRMLLHVLVFYYIFSRTFTARRDYLHALLVGGGVFLVKHAVFFYRYLTGGGLQTGVYHRVLLGSDLPLTALALALAVTALFVYRNTWKHENAAGEGVPMSDRAVSASTRGNAGASLHWLLLLLAVYFTVMLVAGLGKLTYLQAVYSLALVFALHRRDIRLRTVLTVIAAGVAGSLLVFLTVLPAEGRDAILYALGSAFNWWDAIKLYGDLSFGTRLLEIINVWAVLQREGAVLFGLGWGAAWSEIAVHMPFDGGAFGVEEQYTGVHVQTHIDAITFMLKVGIAGTLLIYSSMLRSFFEALRLYKRQRAAWEKWVLMALVLMIIIFAPNYLYFIRLKYLLGFALAGVAVFLGTDESRSAAAAPANGEA